MIKELTESKMKEVQDYLNTYFLECIYICADLQIYGVNSPDVKFWYEEKEGKLQTVFMKYYDSFQIFSGDNDWAAEEYAEWICSFGVTTICGKKSMIEKLEKLLEHYEAAYGIIIEEKGYKEFPQFSMIHQAKIEEAEEIAELICRDEEFKSNYSVDVLTRQLKDRIRKGIGRSFVLREGNILAAHVSTFVENDKIAVESGLIVDAAYKNKFYGLIIHEYLKKVLAEEGKSIYAFRIKENMKRYTHLANEVVCGEYGKMTRK